MKTYRIHTRQKYRHPWDLQPQAAAALQQQLSRAVIRESRTVIHSLRTVAGVDTSYQHGIASAAVVTLQLPELQLIEYASATMAIDYPYVPGLLSFREGPVVVEALGRLKSVPDLIIFDGQGIAHPRRFGIASHIGLLVDIPSVGCAKTRLVGNYREPKPAKGCFTYLTHRGETIGAVLRTRTGVKPVFVSIGHRVDLADSIEIILKCCRKYRLPETTRKADKLSREILSAYREKN